MAAQGSIREAEASSFSLGAPPFSDPASVSSQEVTPESNPRASNQEPGPPRLQGRLRPSWLQSPHLTASGSLQVSLAIPRNTFLSRHCSWWQVTRPRSLASSEKLNFKAGRALGTQPPPDQDSSWAAAPSLSHKDHQLQPGPFQGAQDPSSTGPQPPSSPRYDEVPRLSVGESPRPSLSGFQEGVGRIRDEILGDKIER